MLHFQSIANARQYIIKKVILIKKFTYQRQTQMSYALDQEESLSITPNQREELESSVAS